MTGVVGFGLLASAFAPLVAFLAILKSGELGWVAWVIVAGCVAVMGLLWLVLRGLAKIQLRPLESTAVRRADERVVAFASSYIVPIVITLFGGAGTPALVATSTFVVFLAVVYVRAGLYHLNPTLAVLGYRLYEVTAVNGAVTMLLSRSHHIQQRGDIQCRYLGSDIALQIGKPS